MSRGSLYIRLLLAVICSCAFAPSAGAQQQQGQTGTILGEIRIERGEAPANRIEVTLETHGMVVATNYSDSTGNFFFGHLDVNLYHVLLKEEGYEPVDIQVSVNPIYSTIYRVSIALRPKRPAPAGNKETVSGGNPNMVSPAEYRLHYSKDAMKQFEQGVKAERGHKPGEAMKHYQRAIELAPDFYAARNNLGLVYMAKADYGNAQRQFEEVIRVNPSDTEGYFNLGNVLLLTSHLPDAARAVQQGLQRQPDSAFGKFLLGSIYSRTGNTRAAEQIFEQCLQLDPGMSKTHLALVNLYLQERRTGEAIAQLKAFLKSSPDDPLAPKAKDVLKRLEKASAGTGPQH